MSKKYFHAIATLIGTVIGVGMFSVPLVVAQSGILLFFPYIIILGLIQYYMHLMYAEIVLSTKKRHRVPGYVIEYFGERYKKPVLIVVLISMNLSLLAYLLIGGIFLHEIFFPAFGGNVFFYTFLMFLLAGALTFKGIKMIANLELSMTGLLFLVIGIIVYKGFPHIVLENYSAVSWNNFFLPYGPIFMAIGGMTAIPTVCSLLTHKKSNIRSAIFWGTTLSVVVVAIFVLTVLGVSGSNTTADSLTGLHGSLGNGVLLLTLAFGLISIITSLMMTVEATKEIYWLDLKISKIHSWALSLFVPFVLFLVGINNLTSVVSLSGAVVGGVVGVVYLLLILKVKEKAQLNSLIKIKINSNIAFALSFLFLLGFFNVFEFVSLKTVLLTSFVLFFYLYALIRSDKNNTTIYRELLETGRQTSLIFLAIFVVVLFVGVFSLIL